MVPIVNVCIVGLVFDDRAMVGFGLCGWLFVVAVVLDRRYKLKKNKEPYSLADLEKTRGMSIPPSCSEPSSHLP